MSDEKLSRRVRRTYTDEETGEQLNLVHEEPLKRRPPRDTRSTESFAICFPSGMRVLAQLPLRTSEWAVLAQLVAIMGFEEPFKASPTEIGNALGMDRRNVANDLTRLKQYGIVIEAPDKKVYIHPDYWWRGSLASRVHLLRSLERPARTTPPEGTT